MMGLKTVFVSVTNDLVSDNRVHKVCTSLEGMGFKVTLTGRRRKTSPPLSARTYRTCRMALLFEKGLFFYAEFNFRLFFKLLFSDADVLLANDLDTLPANYLASKIKNKPLVFDSHEYFTEVPELIGRPRVKKIWKTIEKSIVPKIKYAYTVCGSIARLYKNEYGVTFKVVRNIPVGTVGLNTPENKKIKTQKKIVLYQGALNIGRGLPQVIEAMKYTEGILLVLAGDGDISQELKNLAEKFQVNDKVMFTGRLPLEELKYLTCQAHLGLSVEEDMGLNYRYALPNKLFDYIGAEVPVLVSGLPEMAGLVNYYQIGAVISSHQPQQLASAILDALNGDNYQLWKTNLKQAAKELTWENEEKILTEIFGVFC